MVAKNYDEATDVLSAELFFILCLANFLLLLVYRIIILKEVLQKENIAFLLKVL
jgi:hypothetical protein